MCAESVMCRCTRKHIQNIIWTNSITLIFYYRIFKWRETRFHLGCALKMMSQMFILAWYVALFFFLSSMLINSLVCLFVYLMFFHLFRWLPTSYCFKFECLCTCVVAECFIERIMQPVRFFLQSSVFLYHLHLCSCLLRNDTVPQVTLISISSGFKVDSQFFIHNFLLTTSEKKKSEFVLHSLKQ